jgi:hypothetical protein
MVNMTNDEKDLDELYKEKKDFQDVQGLNTKIDRAKFRYNKLL